MPDLGARWEALSPITGRTYSRPSSMTATALAAAFAPTFNGPEGQEDMPYLLTPGPLTTSRGVKLAMLADYGSRDIEFPEIVKRIRPNPLDLAPSGPDYECAIMHGSRTFVIAAAL